MQWTERYGPAPAARGEPRDAWLVTPRIRAAGIVARLAAGACFLGLLGTAATWNEPDSETIFDLARNSTQVFRPGPGYLFGPLLILLVLPGMRGAHPRFSHKHGYRARVATAVVLWIAGLAALIGGVSSVTDATIESGTYIAAALLSAGLLATLAMWPAGLRHARVDDTGQVHAPDVGEGS